MTQSLNFSSLDVNQMTNSDKWLEDIQKSSNGTEKMLQSVVVAVRCPEKCLRLFQLLISRSQHAIQNCFWRSRVEAHAFGSYVTGLCLKSCDLDLCIDFEPSLPNQDMLQAFKRIRRALYSEFGYEFSRMHCIPAKIPILQCIHVSGFQCDISISNKLALHNSLLIKFYLNLNDSFYPFFMCLKLWSKRQGFSGSNFITSYALVLLGLFYLQQEKDIPSVYELQKHPSCIPLHINTWNCAVPKDVNSFRTKREPLPVLSLLAGFFQFYSEFEFGYYVLSLYSGEKYLKPFDDPPDIFESYRNSEIKMDLNKYMCVQDPFEQSFNVCRNTTRNIYVNFQNGCRTAAAICSQSESPAFLKQLFSKYEKGARKRTIQANEFILTVVMGKTVWEGITELDQRSNWVEVVKRTLNRILKNVLLGKVEEQGNTYVCHIEHYVLGKKLRSEVTKELNLPNSLHGIERLECVSNAIFEKSQGKTDAPVDLTIKVEVLTKPSRVQLHCSMAPFHHGMFDNLSNNLINWIENAIENK